MKETYADHDLKKNAMIIITSHNVYYVMFCVKV